MIESGNELCGCQIVPGRAVALQLEHSAFIRMQEILSARNPVSVLRANHAARPTSGGHASPVLFLGSNHMDAVIHTILDSRGSSRDQPSVSLALLSCHAVYDATEALPVSPTNFPNYKAFVYSWLPSPKAVINVMGPTHIPDLGGERPSTSVTI